MRNIRKKAKDRFQDRSDEIECKMNQILFDLDNSDDVETLQGHMLLISTHLETYRELELKGIDLPFDYKRFYLLHCALFEKICKLLGV